MDITRFAMKLFISWNKKIAPEKKNPMLSLFYMFFNPLAPTDCVKYTGFITP